MTPSDRAATAASRRENYGDIMRTTIWGLIAVVALAAFSSTAGLSLPLAVLTVTLTAYGMLAGDRALNDLKNLVADLDDKSAATNYGMGAQSAPFDKLRAISAGLVGLTGLATLIMVL